LELRLDLISSDRPKKLIEASPVPVIVTVRSHEEGGESRYSPDATAELLMSSIDAGAAYVDVELSLPARIRNKITSHAGADRVILSKHFPGGTPSTEDLATLLERMLRERPGIIKIVSMALTFADNLQILGLIRPAIRRSHKIAAFCMGEPGRLSRILSLVMGSTLGFASFEDGDETAAGQIPIQAMRQIFSRGTS
jgi:3-dehydroquinate dehydratase type I